MNKHHALPGSRPFAAPDRFPGPLSARTAATILAAIGDVVFVLDGGGAILDVAISNGELAPYGFGDWAGRRWIETVTVESKPKVREMLTSAENGAGARWRQVNHVTPNGEVPVRYLVLSTGERGGLIAVGRDLREAAAMQQRLLETQQSLERDYLKMRQAEARYRLLFDLAAEPTLIADAATRRIREANPAALRLLGVREDALAGQPVGAIVDSADRDALVAYLGAAEAAEDAGSIRLGLPRGLGRARIGATLFRQARASLLLIRLAADGADGSAASQDSRVDDIVERMPDAFVLADADLNVLAANAAFAELVQVPSIERLRAAPLADWLGRPGIDLDLIVDQIRSHGAVRNAATIVRGAAGGREEVEISGVAAPDGDRDCYGFTIRNIGRRLRAPAAAERDVPRTVDQLTELVGRMSLKEIVRESTDLVERLCIEAALAYTSDNRASAAEILGVSRQSLYSKLHRHGLGNLVQESH